MIAASVGATGIQTGHGVFDAMFAATNRPSAPRTVVVSDDTRRARLSIIRRVLSTIEYTGKDEEVRIAGPTRRSWAGAS